MNSATVGSSLLACVLVATAAPVAAELPFPFRQEAAELENPFQRSVSSSPPSAAAAPSAEADPPSDVRLASAIEGTWVDPPPVEPAVEVADVYVSPYEGPELGYPADHGPWYWELLPDGLIWHSYLAGPREPRISLVTFSEGGSGDWLWDTTLGGRRSLLRFGNGNPQQPEGYEVQVEGAALLRLNLEQNRDVDSSDYRVGFPLVYGNRLWQFKTGYYHLSSHLGDEFMVRNPDAMRINYVRDAIMLGFSFTPDPAWRFYAEADYAFYAAGGAEPWEFQLGFEYSQPGPTGCAGTPFVAANGHLREELNYGGDFTFQAGWLWRGATGSTFRTGLHYLTGKSPQYQFYDTSEEQIGFGVWYDY